MRSPSDTRQACTRQGLHPARGCTRQRRHYALDADGVIFDFDAAWRACASVLLSTDLTVQSPAYCLQDRYGLSNRDVQKVWTAWNLNRMWRRVPAFPQVVDGLRMLLDMQHDVTIITLLPDAKAGEDRRIALNMLGLHQVHLVTVSASKREALRQCRPDFYADDCWQFCAEAQDIGRSPSATGSPCPPPFVARIQAGHDGGGTAIEGVREFPDVLQALAFFHAHG
ncbi:hypothetical protein RIE95_08945 [Acidithiobacillus thiooxidans]|uniref:hypothetical protein n=1 Tax=Acidithiobacillus thiooxidans TaxID=930 RepID=UPI002865BBA3|nr:hypothetical protein [Acidithiobacillus thiooxidans]MDR7927102.1 hypothetical protein [Acidithiobacillus thiooxidans]